MSRFFLGFFVTFSLWGQTSSDSAHSLARRIRAALTLTEVPRLSFHDVPPAARQAIEADLASSPARPGSPEVNITFSEDQEGYLSIAEIVRAGKREAVLIERAAPPPAEPTAPAIAIQKMPVWEQEAPILDLVADGADIVVLSPAGVSIWTRTETGWTLRKALPIAPAHPWPRDLRGRLSAKGDLLGVFLPGTVCSGALRPDPQLHCEPGEEAWPGQQAAIPEGRNYFLASGAPPFFSSALGITAGLDGEPWGSDIVAVESPCGARILATQPGEADAPDAIQAFELQEGRPILRGAPVDFRGPVTALWQTADPTRALAVSRDLASGRYAAFTLSIACSR